MTKFHSEIYILGYEAAKTWLGKYYHLKTLPHAISTGTFIKTDGQIQLGGYYFEVGIVSSKVRARAGIDTLL